MTDIKDFLNPNSMLTPGLAGGLTTALTMPLVTNFEDLKFKYVALVISFLLALLMAHKEQITRLQKAIYCIFNSLIIFSVSVGAGINFNSPPPLQQKQDPSIVKLLERIQSSGTGQLSSTSKESAFLGISKAYAEPPQPRREEELKRMQRPVQPGLSREEAERLQKYLEQQRQQQEKQRRYYKRWSW